MNSDYDYDYRCLGLRGTIVYLEPAEVEAARHMLWHAGEPGGWEPGSFSKALLDTLVRADSTNRLKILKAFPEFRRPAAVLRQAGAEALLKLVEYPSEGLAVGVDDKAAQTNQTKAAKIVDVWKELQESTAAGVPDGDRHDHLQDRLGELCEMYGVDLAGAYLELREQSVALGVIR